MLPIQEKEISSEFKDTIFLEFSFTILDVIHFFNSRIYSFSDHSSYLKPSVSKKHIIAYYSN
jgi:hypothetical protein